jgi:adenylate cyclase
MSFEIERKFLVRSDAWRELVTGSANIRQAYLDKSANVSVRIRIKDNRSATLTLKSRPSALRRMEMEYAIPVLEAEALLPLRQGLVVEKVRYTVPYGELAWEVDVFSGENSGLVLAEIELPDEHHPIELPSWLGVEVTGQTQYYNGTLAHRPYRSWKRDGDVVALEQTA